MGRGIFFIPKHAHVYQDFFLSSDAIFATSPTTCLDSILRPELKLTKIKGKTLFTLFTGF